MKTILTIGHQRFLLPASANVNVILKALSNAQSVKRDYDYHTECFRLESGTPGISVQVVNDKQVIQPKKPKQIPAAAGPDANGSEIERPD